MVVLTPEDDVVWPTERKAAWRMLQCLPALAQAAQQLHFDLAAELMQQPLALRTLVQDSLSECQLVAWFGLQPAHLVAAADQGSRPATAEWALALARAAQAALQLLLCAADQLVLGCTEQEPGRAEEEEESTPASLAGQCLDVAYDCLSFIQPLARSWRHLPGAPTLLQRQQLGQQLRQLHATTCRLVHFAAAASEAQRAALPALAQWATMLSCISFFPQVLVDFDVLTDR